MDQAFKNKISRLVEHIVSDSDVLQRIKKRQEAHTYE